MSTSILGAEQRPELELQLGCFAVKLPSRLNPLRHKPKPTTAGQAYLQNLLSLPNELQTLILLELDVQDLLSLRLSSRSLFSLVECCSPALVRGYIKSTLSSLETGLYPAPLPGQANFRWLLDVEHRIQVSRNLTFLLCDFFTWSLRTGLRRRSERVRLQRSYRMLFRAMAPLVFTLNHFFEHYRRMILERAMKNWSPTQKFQISTGGPTLWDDQMSILDRYSPALMLDCYHVYGYLLQVLEFQLRPNKIERALRSLQGLKAEMCCTPEVEMLLMLGGMEQVYRVLKGTTYSRRRDALDNFINSLKPTTNVLWRSQWEKMNIASEHIRLDKIQNLRLRLPALHLVWVPSALKLLLCSKIINRVDFSNGSTARSPSDFISDLIGFDLQADLQQFTEAYWFDEDNEDEENDDDDDVDDDDDADSNSHVSLPLSDEFEEDNDENGQLL